MPTLAVLAIGNPIRVYGWISIRAGAGTTKHGRFSVGGSSPGVGHATNFASKPVFPSWRKLKGVDKGPVRNRDLDRK